MNLDIAVRFLPILLQRWQKLKREQTHERMMLELHKRNVTRKMSTQMIWRENWRNWLSVASIKGDQHRWHLDYVWGVWLWRRVWVWLWQQWGLDYALVSNFEFFIYNMLCWDLWIDDYWDWFMLNSLKLWNWLNFNFILAYVDYMKVNVICWLCYVGYEKYIHVKQKNHQPY